MPLWQKVKCSVFKSKDGGAPVFGVRAPIHRYIPLLLLAFMVNSQFFHPSTIYS